MTKRSWPRRRREHRGGIQVLDRPGLGEFVHVGRDAVDDRGHPPEVGGYDGPVRPVGGRTHVTAGG
jgi:hypothetical protein